MYTIVFIYHLSIYKNTNALYVYRYVKRYYANPPRIHCFPTILKRNEYNLFTLIKSPFSHNPNNTEPLAFYYDYCFLQKEINVFRVCMSIS